MLVWRSWSTNDMRFSVHCGREANLTLMALRFLKAPKIDKSCTPQNAESYMSWRHSCLLSRSSCFPCKWHPKLSANLDKSDNEDRRHGPTMALDQSAQYGHAVVQSWSCETMFCDQVANAQPVNLQDVGSVSVGSTKNFPKSCFREKQEVHLTFQSGHQTINLKSINHRSSYSRWAPCLASSSNPGGLCHVQLITVISLVPVKSQWCRKKAQVCWELVAKLARWPFQAADCQVDLDILGRN